MDFGFISSADYDARDHEKTRAPKYTFGLQAIQQLRCSRGARFHLGAGRNQKHLLTIDAADGPRIDRILSSPPANSAVSA